MNAPRGIRNHNPGNIRHGAKWQGLASSQTDSEFCQFASPQWGIRALARTLITYQDTHGLRSVAEIISRWAPPVGDRNGAAPGGQYTQRTDRYIVFVANRLGVDAGAPVDVHSYAVARPLVEAIIRHECSRGPLDNPNSWYAAGVIDAGLRLAGIVAPPKPLAASRTMQGAALAGLGTFGEVASDTAQQLGAVSHVSPMLQTICNVLLVAGVLLAIYGRLQVRQRSGE